MIICKGDTAYKCIKMKVNNMGKTQSIQFSLPDAVSPTDIKKLFADDTFYFYDDVLKGKLPDKDNTKLVGLCITYNADSTCKIIIKLKKGVGDNES